MDRVDPAPTVRLRLCRVRPTERTPNLGRPLSRNLILERALYLIATEWGKTRADTLKWLVNDDDPTWDLTVPEDGTPTEYAEWLELET